MSTIKDIFNTSIQKDITVEIPLIFESDNPGYKTLNEEDISKIINFNIKSVLLTIPGERIDPNFGVGAPTSPIQVVVDGDQYLAIRSNVRQPDALDGDGSRIGLASNFRPVGGGIIVHWHLSVTDPV